MALKMDPNSGPLTLEHDPRPRDLNTDPNLNPLYQDFRFKGWPDGNFQHSKQPQYKKMSASYMNPSEVNRYFGKAHHFDTGPYQERAKTDRPFSRTVEPPVPRPTSVKRPDKPIAEKVTDIAPDTHRDLDRPALNEGYKGPQYNQEDTQPRTGPMRGLGYADTVDMEKERARQTEAEFEADRIRVRNEERRRAQEREEERRRIAEEQFLQKRKDMEMLRKYDPWGRPGGGAPRGDNRKMKFTEHQATPRDTLEYKDNWEPAFPDIEQYEFKSQLQPSPDDQLIQIPKQHSINNGTSYYPSQPTDPRRERSVDEKDTKPSFLNRMKEEHNQQRQSSNTSSRCYGTIVDSFGTPGGGAPLRTTSGNLQTSIIGHELLRFQENGKNVVDNTLRYSQDPAVKQEYAGNLDKQMRQEELRRQEEKLSSLKHELDHLKSSQQYSDRGNHLRLRNKLYHSWDPYEMMRVQNRDSFQDRAKLDTYDPWGRGIGNPARLSDGRLQTLRKSLLGRKLDNGYDNDRGIPWTAPETNRSFVNPNDEYDNLGKIGKAKKPNREILPIYYPFGKPGGGAPIIDQNKKISTTLHGYSDDTPETRRQKKINAKVLAATLDEQVEFEHRRKQMEKEEKRKPFGEMSVIIGDKVVGRPRRNPETGVLANHHLGSSDISRQFGELAVIFDDKLTGKPRRDPISGMLQNHHLPNSDVSLQKMNYQPFAKREQKAYHETLDLMADERSRRQKLGKLKEYQEGRQHYDTMDRQWGKHGGGAPKGHELRKANLEDILHHPTRDQSTEEYIKKKDWSEVEPEKFFIREDDDLYEMRRSPIRQLNNPLTAREDGSYSPHGNPKKFVRSTVTSNHANQYDYRDDYPKKDYKIGAPYATH